MIANFLQKNKKIVGLLFLILVFVAIPINFQTANAEDSVGCPILPDALCDPIGVVAAALLRIPMAIAAWILWFSGLMLNTVLEYTVTNMSSNIDGITGITIAWATIRDLANMSFLFVLLYIAISTILGRSGSQWKSTLVSIVIAAILINFSLFFTKVIIDASNVITLGFYKQIVPNASVDIGLSNSIMQPLGLTSLWNPTEGIATLAEFTGSLSKIAILSIGSAVFMGITAFVFMAAAIMFLVRYVTIIFLLILSPIALMGSVLPRLKEHASKWWKSLLGQAVFAPLFMIMVWVVLTIIGSGGFACLAPNGAPTARLADNFSGITNSTATTPTPNCPTSISLAMNFIIINALIIGTLVIAKQASEQAGSSAQKIVGGALGLGLGTAGGWAGRQTAGRLGSALSDSKTVKELAAKDGFVGGLGRLALRNSQKAASGSFDIRASRFAGMGKSLGMGDLGIDGKAEGKDGYKKQLENQIKKKEGMEEAIRSTSSSEIYRESKDLIDFSKREAEWKKPAVENELKEARRKASEMRKSDPTSRVVEAEAAMVEKKAKEKYDLQMLEIEKIQKEKAEKARAQAEENAKKSGAERSKQYIENIDKKRWDTIWVDKKDKEAARKLRNKRKEKSDDEKIVDLLKKRAEEEAKKMKKPEDDKKEEEAGKEKEDRK